MQKMKKKKKRKNEKGRRVRVVISQADDISKSPKFICFETWVYFSFGENFIQNEVSLKKVTMIKYCDHSIPRKLNKDISNRKTLYRYAIMHDGGRRETEEGKYKLVQSAIVSHVKRKRKREKKIVQPQTETRVYI